MKRVLALLLSCLLLVSFSGCAEPPPEPTPELTDEEISLQQQEIIKIGFSSSEDEDVIEEVLTLDELMAWENPYGIYSSYYFYNTLLDEEQYVYRALEYAMVHSYKYTLIDYRIGVKDDKNERIAEYLSLDSPLLEQNLVIAAYSKVAFYDYQVNEERSVKVLHRSNTISIRNFSEEAWQKKMLALEEAKNVFATFNTDTTEIELAEEIYRYIALGVEYIPYENEYGHYKGTLVPFLYDALINKKTHCDGFTNALALLFAMAGFEQIEKTGYTADSGHTWNCVKLDGKWYNCDGTAGDLIPKNAKTMGGGLRFAFADSLQFTTLKYEDKYPICEKSYYMEPDAFLKECTDDEFYKAIDAGFWAHQNEWALVIVEGYEKSVVDMRHQEMVNRYGRGLDLCTIHLTNGKTALLFCKNGVLQTD